MTFDAGDITTLIGVVLALIGIYWKVRRDRSDVLGQMSDNYDKCLKRWAGAAADVARLTETGEALQARLDQLEANWAEAEGHMAELTGYIDRLLTWLIGQGITPPEQPPKRKKKS